MKFWVDIEFRHHDGSVHRKLSIKLSVFGQNVADTNRISDKHWSFCCDHSMGIVCRHLFGKGFLVVCVVYKGFYCRSVRHRWTRKRMCPGRQWYELMNVG